MFIVVMDVTNKTSVRRVPEWASLVRDQSAVRADATRGILVANKTDLESRRLIGSAEGRELASSLQLEYIECSAVTTLHSIQVRVLHAKAFHLHYNGFILFFRKITKV